MTASRNDAIWEGKSSAARASLDPSQARPLAAYFGDRLRKLTVRQKSRNAGDEIAGHVYAPVGVAISKVDPRESDLASRSLPPWFSTTVRQIASPNPMPAGLV